jgi:serine/threonine-protein kinase HipA
VFNVIFNNRDDHGKNFSFRMGKDGHWKLAPVYDITFNRGPGGYHQMDVAGEASIIRLTHLHQLGKEAGVSKKETTEIISRIAQEASLFSARVLEYDGAIRRQTEQNISRILQANIKAATS